MVYTPFGQGLQSRVNERPDDGFPGLVRQIRNSVDAIYPISPNYQETVITLGAVTAATDYRISIAGYTLTINSEAMDDNAFREAVVAQMLRDSQVGSLFRTEESGTDIKLTHRFRGVSTLVAVTGGVATATTTAPTTQGLLPLGRVVVIDSAQRLDDELPSVRLPSGASDRPFGLAGASSHAYPRLIDPATGAPMVGYRAGEALTVLRDCSIWMPIEAECGAGQVLYYRHTASGVKNAMGMIAPAAGAGLALLKGAETTGPSVRMSTGELIVPVDFNIPSGG